MPATTTRAAPITHAINRSTDVGERPCQMRKLTWPRWVLWATKTIRSTRRIVAALAAVHAADARVCATGGVAVTVPCGPSVGLPLPPTSAAPAAPSSPPADTSCPPARSGRSVVTTPCYPELST